MINVLHLRDTDKICGPGKTIIETACRIDKGAFNLSIGLFLRSTEKDNIYYKVAKQRGIDVIPIRMGHQFDISVIYKIIRIIKEKNIHILHSHEYKSDIIAFFVSKLIKIPIITTIHGWIENSFKSKVYIRAGKKVLPYFNKVVAVSPKIKSQLVSLGVPEGNIPLIYNAIVVENYVPGSYPQKVLRTKYNLPDDAILIGNVGRLSQEKGQTQFLLAARDICRRNDKTYFVMVGDGPDLEQLKKTASHFQIKNRVIFTGHVQDVRPFYQDLDIIALTSFTEGFPNVILEALCMKKPVVATDVGGVADIVIDGVTGYLAQAGDHSKIGEKLLNLIENPEIAGLLVENGRKRIKEEFQFSNRVQKIENVYSNILT